MALSDNLIMHMNKNNLKTILVVEDDKSLSRIIVLKLNAAGYRVLLAGTGEMALEMLQTETPDLIWLDIYLPGMDGFEFLENLRKNPKTKDTKVVIVSVSASSKKLKLAEKFKISDYFVKSNYRIDELVELVTASLAAGK